MAADLFTIKGEFDEDGAPRDGMWSSMNLTRTAIAHPKVIYGDKLLTLDLYSMRGALMVNLYCPRCENSLRIEAARKAIEWDPEVGLFIEPFRCTWELPERDGERISFGLNLCRWTVGITPVAKEMDTSEGRIRIHGIARGR